MVHDHGHIEYDPAAASAIACDLCGSRDSEPLGSSRDGRARAVICRRCGLIYISPRMPQEWYSHFYQRAYREREGELADLGRIFEKGRAHGRALARELAGFLPAAGVLVEVGSSAGGVLAGIRDQLPGLAVLGIEPSAREAAYAGAHGVPTQIAMIEDVRERGVLTPPADLVLSAQSLNHFLSPRSFFVWALRQLKPAGRLVVEVKNFRQQARRSGRVENSIEIDHVYMFAPETLAEYLGATGFRVLAMRHDEGLSLNAIGERRGRGLPGYQVIAVAEKTAAEPLSRPEEAIDPTAYRRIRGSLRPWRISLHHFLRYRRFSELFPRA